MSTTPRRTGYALVLAAAALFAVNGTVSKVALEAGSTPATLTGLRVTGTAVALLAVTALRPGSRLRLSWRELPVLALYGVVGVALIQWLYFVAIDRLPVGVAVLLEFTGAVLVALYARVVLGEPVRRRMWAALGFSLAGLALVAQVWRGSALDPVGVLAGAGAACALATYYLLGQHTVRIRDPLSVTCWSFVFGAVFWNTLHPASVLDLRWLGSSAPLLGSLHGVAAPVWVLLAWIVLLGTLVPSWLSLAALSRLPATQVGVTATAEPVLAAGVGWLWLGQALSLAQLAGGVVVVGGIALAQSARRPAYGASG